eukprot:15470701-Alexandrium_andersonii.AAC.1
MGNIPQGSIYSSNPASPIPARTHAEEIQIPKKTTIYHRSTIKHAPYLPGCHAHTKSEWHK